MDVAQLGSEAGSHDIGRSGDERWGGGGGRHPKLMGGAAPKRPPPMLGGAQTPPPIYTLTHTLNHAVTISSKERLMCRVYGAGRDAGRDAGD